MTFLAQFRSATLRFRAPRRRHRGLPWQGRGRPRGRGRRSARRAGGPRRRRRDGAPARPRIACWRRRRTRRSGLALLADACETAHLDAELALTLEELARRAPSSAEVWVRLARARQATGSPPDEVRDPLVRALAVAQSGSDARIDALIGLADLDLAQGDGARAELWIERAAPVGPGGRLAAAPRNLGRARVGHRRAERRGAAASRRRRRREGRARGVAGRADRRASGPGARARARHARRRGGVRPAPPRDGARHAGRERGALVGARVRAERRADAHARPLGRRREGRAGAGAMARGVRERRGRARRRAARAARGGRGRATAPPARPLLDAAIEDRDADALRRRAREAAGRRRGPRCSSTHARRRDRRDADARCLDRGDARIDARRDRRGGPSAPGPVGRRARGERRARVDPGAGAPAAWPQLLARLDAHAHAVGDLARRRAGRRPRRRALAARAPRHRRRVQRRQEHLHQRPHRRGRRADRSAPDDRDAPPPALGARPLRARSSSSTASSRASASSPSATCAPPCAASSPRRSGASSSACRSPSLVSVEILDTPGFNAPDPRHADVARSALEEADVAVWLLDATQAMKQSEREVLEEARRIRLPVQMLVNKADRLGEADLARVMASVARGSRGDEGRLLGPAAGALREEGAGQQGGRRGRRRPWRSRAGPRCRRCSRSRSWRAARSSRSARSADARRRSSAASSSAWATRDAADRADAAGAERARARGRARGDAASSATPTASPSGSPNRCRRRRRRGRGTSSSSSSAATREAAARDPVLARYRVDRAVAAIAPALVATPCRPSCRRSTSRPARLAPLAPRRGARRRVVRARRTLPGMLAAIAQAAVATLVEQLLAMSVAPAPVHGRRGRPARAQRVPRRPRAVRDATVPGHDVPASRRSRSRLRRCSRRSRSRAPRSSAASGPSP